MKSATLQNPTVIDASCSAQFHRRAKAIEARGSKCVVAKDAPRPCRTATKRAAHCLDYLHRCTGQMGQFCKSLYEDNLKGYLPELQRRLDGLRPLLRTVNVSRLSTDPDYAQAKLVELQAAKVKINRTFAYFTDVYLYAQAVKDL